MLAAELALAGVDVAVVERRANQELAGSRAGALHARCCSISVSPASSTSLPGRIGFDGSKRDTLVRGSSRCWARSTHRRPC